MRNILLLLLALNFWLGCQQSPTKVYETQQVTAKGGAQEPGKIEITSSTIIADARPAFEYTVAHLNGSIALRPEDFTQKKAPFQGLLEMDHFSLTRRLARLGISPETPVVVVGRGPKGAGEEGRVAWTLKYLGVKDVRFAAIDYFSLPLSTSEAPPKKNAVIWKPELDESLLVSKEDFQAAIKDKSALIIDVRPSEVYLGKAGAPVEKKLKDIGAINIPWTEFLTPKGLTNTAIRPRLESVGITPQKRIYVISERGVESATVTLALRELGYAKASNFAGGYLQLSSTKGN